MRSLTSLKILHEEICDLHYWYVYFTNISLHYFLTNGYPPFLMGEYDMLIYTRSEILQE
jgi:hypothetical protein